MNTSNDHAPLTMLYTGNAPSWQNPSLTNINKLPPHATLYPYADAASALSGDRGRSPWVQPVSYTHLTLPTICSV